MKQITTFFLLLVAYVASAEVQKETRSIGEFQSIEVSKGANITLIQCNKTELEVVTDGCPLTDVETFVKGGVLQVRMKKRTPGSAVQVSVYFQDINQLDIKTGASAETGCIFEHKGTFALNVGAKCEAELKIDVEELVVNANSCNISLRGSAQKQTVDIAGTVADATYDAVSLQSQTISIKASNTKATVNFSEALTADVKDGELKYKGDASAVKATTSYSGTIGQL